MARRSTCRVLVAAGKPVEQPPVAPARRTGISLEIGKTTAFAEIAKTRAADRAPYPSLDKSHDVIQIDDDVYAAGMRIGEPDVDPRDVPLRKLDQVMRWALDWCPWPPAQRQVIEALWVESGDTEAVSRILAVPLEFVTKLLTRARSEVVMAAKALEWQDEFLRSRLSGEWPHKVTTMQIDDGRLWFIDPSEPEIYTREVGV
jgi:hypothetical protein